MKQMTEAELRKLLEEAYEAGAEDSVWHKEATKETRDEYVDKVISEV